MCLFSSWSQQEIDFRVNAVYCCEFVNYSKYAYIFFLKHLLKKKILKAAVSYFFELKY